MHLKQQNILLINKIWTTENFQQEASSGSQSFHPVFGNTKSDYQERDQSNYAFWFTIVHLKEHKIQFLFYYVVCNDFQTQADLTKSENYASFAMRDFNFVNIDNAKAEFGGGLQWPSHNHITPVTHFIACRCMSCMCNAPNKSHTYYIYITHIIYM